VVINLGLPLRRGSSGLPEGIGPGIPRPQRGSPSYLALLRVGFGQPAGRPAAGGLLPHLFTLTAGIPAAVWFLCHFPRVTPPGCYPARCPVEPGPSSPRSQAGSDHPAHWTPPPITILHPPCCRKVCPKLKASSGDTHAGLGAGGHQLSEETDDIALRAPCPKYPLHTHGP